jgi:putative spermidine/putrescine transport system permease protein
MQGIPRWVAFALRLATVAIMAFIYVPIGIIVLYSFNAAKVATWPITSFTIDWYTRAFSDAGIRAALGTSIQAAIGATVVSLILGSLLALAVARYRFFGRETIAFLVILPLALPGIVTGLALNTAFRTIGFDFGIFTIVVGHATFCVVVMYNNAIARLRRTSRSYEEASADLGADAFTTFRRVTFPALRTALIAGALLAFALSFDEIIVTNFLAGPGVQTLPIWIFSNYSRPNQLPLVNVAAVLVLVASIIPVYLASRLTADPAAVPGGRT